MLTLFFCLFHVLNSLYFNLFIILFIYLFIYLSIHILKSPISLNAIYAAVGNQNKSKIIDTGIVI